MTVEEFNDTFIEPFVLLDRATYERTTQTMLCDNCAEAYGDGGAVLIRRLHVTIEDDPLGNFWKLAQLRCHVCGFNEHVPLDKPSLGGGVGTDLVDVWDKELRAQQNKREEELKRQIYAQQMAAAQAQNQAATAAQMRLMQDEANQRLNQLSKQFDQGLGREIDQLHRLYIETVEKGEQPPKGLMERINVVARKLQGR